jgi:hypothetical protein
MGLRVLQGARADLRVEGVEGQHWVKAADLPQYSAVNCEKYSPAYQPKKICYDYNKQNIITWVRYNA